MKVVLGLATAVAAAATLVASPESPKLTGFIRPNGHKGISVSTQDFAVSLGGRVCLMTPDWGEVFLRSVPTPTRPPITVRKLADGYVETIAPAEASGQTSIEEYSVRCQDNTATVTIRAAAPQGGKTVMMEHVAFVIPAGLLEGASYEVVNDGGVRKTGVISRIQKDKTRRGLLYDFRKGVFKGDLGSIEIEVVKGPQVRLDDRRSAIFEGHGSAFIVWTGSIPVSETGSAEQVLTLTFRYPASQTAEGVSVKPSGALENAVRPAEKQADFPLLPMPVKFTAHAGEYRPAEGDRLFLAGGSGLLRKHASAIAGLWNMQAEPCDAASAKAKGIVLTAGSNPEDESYSLVCDGNGVRIQAGGERAAFYALQTLRGLYRNGAFRHAEIQDKPAFGIRAVHVMADADTRESLTRLITQVLAPLKINTLFIECPFVQWDATRGMYRPESMPKSDLKEVLRIAEENYIKVYPLLPTYSHSEWFFWNNKNLEMIDNPKDRTAYNSLHPGVHPFLTKLFDEVLETFGNPEYFHISHDEVSREHPQKPEGKKLGIRELFRRDVMWHYDFFRKRHVKLMLWHDMLVAKKETGKRPVANARGGSETLRKELPKDITVCVWNYEAPLKGTYPEVDVVASDKFPVLGAGWYLDGNLEELTGTCLRNKAKGMIVTTWHWKVRSGGVLYTQYAQIHSYVRAASLFWNPAYSTGNFSAPEVLVDLLRKPEREPGVMHSVAFTGNTLVSKELPDLAGLKGEEVSTQDGVRFRLLRDNDGELGGLCVESRRFPHLPGKIRIPLKKEYTRLHLLHTAFNRGTRPDKMVVKLVFRYTDGSYEAVLLRNGTDVGYGSVPMFKQEKGQMTYRPDEVATLYDVPSFQRNQYNSLVWKTPSGTACSVWSYTWVNPHPEKKLDHLLLEAKDKTSAYCLLGLTGETK